MTTTDVLAQHEGYTVVDQVRTLQPVALLLDITLPEVDGLSEPRRPSA